MKHALAVRVEPKCLDRINSIARKVLWTICHLFSHPVLSSTNQFMLQNYLEPFRLLIREG